MQYAVVVSQRPISDLDYQVSLISGLRDMMRWLPIMATMAWGLSPGPWLEGPGPGEVTYYFNRSILMTTQQHVYISTRKFSNVGVAGHSLKEGHHVGGPWGTKGRHHHDSKRLQHSPGGIR